MPTLRISFDSNRAARLYSTKRRRAIDVFPAVRASEAAHCALMKLAPCWLQDPIIAQRAHEASTQMRRSLVAGFAQPAGSKARHQEHKAAWRAARVLDNLVGSAMRSDRTPKELCKAALAAQRAVDRADVLISALPGVEVI